MSIRLGSLVAPVIVAGCTGMLGIDGKYELGVSNDAGPLGRSGHATGGVEATETGGATTGGMPGKGGTPGSGGQNSGGMTGGTGGSAETGGAGMAASCNMDGATCAIGEKCCTTPDGLGASCVTPAPIVGCDAPDCNRCPSPPNANAVAVCTAGSCDFECNANYTRTGNDCVQNSAGGASGAGGATTTPVCKSSNCPGCGVFGIFGCCRNNGTCGCTYAPGQFCL